MNIIVSPYSRTHFYLRPDTSVNRNKTDFYIPEFVTAASVAPFAYIKISKAGKAVLKRFAKRYYNCVGYGVGVRADSIIEADHASFSVANALDMSTYFLESQPIVTDIYEETPTPPLLYKNGEIVATSDPLKRELIEAEIERITQIINVRQGDIILFELIEKGIEISCHDEIGFGELSFLIK